MRKLINVRRENENLIISKKGFYGFTNFILNGEQIKSDSFILKENDEIRLVDSNTWKIERPSEDMFKFKNLDTDNVNYLEISNGSSRDLLIAGKKIGFNKGIIRELPVANDKEDLLSQFCKLLGYQPSIIKDFDIPKKRHAESGRMRVYDLMIVTDGKKEKIVGRKYNAEERYLMSDLYLISDYNYLVTLKINPGDIRILSGYCKKEYREELYRELLKQILSDQAVES